jgi:hypothetical protein
MQQRITKSQFGFRKPNKRGPANPRNLRMSAPPVRKLAGASLNDLGPATVLVAKKKPWQTLWSIAKRTAAVLFCVAASAALAVFLLRESRVPEYSNRSPYKPVNLGRPDGRAAKPVAYASKNQEPSDADGFLARGSKSLGAGDRSVGAGSSSAQRARNMPIDQSDSSKPVLLTRLSGGCVVTGNVMNSIGECIRAHR